LDFTLDSTGKKLGQADVDQCKRRWEQDRNELVLTAAALFALGAAVMWIAAGCWLLASAFAKRPDTMNGSRFDRRMRRLGAIMLALTAVALAVGALHLLGV
jgi:hypothetical protein